MCRVKFGSIFYKILSIYFVAHALTSSVVVEVLHWALNLYNGSRLLPIYVTTGFTGS